MRPWRPPASPEGVHAHTGWAHSLSLNLQGSGLVSRPAGQPEGLCSARGCAARQEPPSCGAGVPLGEPREQQRGEHQCGHICSACSPGPLPCEAHPEHNAAGHSDGGDLGRLEGPEYSRLHWWWRQRSRSQGGDSGAPAWMQALARPEHRGVGGLVCVTSPSQRGGAGGLHCPLLGQGPWQPHGFGGAAGWARGLLGGCTSPLFLRGGWLWGLLCRQGRLGRLFAWRLLGGAGI